MKKNIKELIIRYLVSFSIACLITVIVFAIKGFFSDNMAANIQVLSDGFCVSGALMSMFAGLFYVSSEGAFIGIGFVLRNVVLAFIPMGRAKHELYAQYRERKMEGLKKFKEHHFLFTGLFFLAIGIVFTVIWYVNFYNVI